MKSNQGLGLVEVLIAIAILTVGVVAVMRLFPASLRQAQIAEGRTIAAELAESELAKIRTAGSGYFLDLGLTSLDAIENVYGQYSSYASNLTRMRGTAETQLQRVTFTVQMPDGTQETFVTYISQQ